MADLGYLNMFAHDIQKLASIQPIRPSSKRFAKAAHRSFED